MQSDLFRAEEIASSPPPKQPSSSKKAAGHEGPAPDDTRPNLNLLDVRIYGIQVPIDLGDCSYRFDGMTPEQIKEFRLKFFPLACVYTAEDFTPEGKVKILRRRGYSFDEIVCTWPDLAGTAMGMATAPSVDGGG